MRKILTLLAIFIAGVSQAQYQIIIHGGAGNGLRSDRLSKEQIDEFHLSLEQALRIGDSAQQAGLSALETVSLVIQSMENNPVFNAGKGAVLTYEGQASLDASIMDGSNLAAGAVAGLSCIKNPITAALAVLESSPHVLLSGPGADSFAVAMELTKVDPSYFITESKIKGWKRWLKSHSYADTLRDFKMGTVGCVVRDREGNIAAGTSTGGMMGKRHGRIGDSPVIGAGTYANSKTVGISCTGHGEFFIRNAVAYQISARYELQEQNGQKMADWVVQKILKEQGGDGGVIGIDAQGGLIVSFNTAGMLRGSIKEGEAPQTRIFKD